MSRALTKRGPETTHGLNARQLNLMAELKREPAEVVERLRRLLAEEGELRRSLRLPDFQTFINDLEQAVVQSITEDYDRACVFAEVGMVEALIEVVKADGYFSWDVHWRAKPVLILIILIEQVALQSSAGARERICRTTRGLFKSVWDRRDIVRLSDPGIRHLGGVIDDSTMLCSLVQTYYLAYDCSDRVPELDTYIHHVHLLFWVLSHEEDEVPNLKLHSMLTTSLHAAWGPSLEDIVQAEEDVLTDPSPYLAVRDRFVKESIIEGVGPDRFIDACEADLRTLLNHVGCNCENGVHDIRLLVRHVISSDYLMPFIYRRDLLGQALDVLKNLFAAEFGAGMCTSLCISCLYLIMAYFNYSAQASVTAAEPHRYPDIVDLHVIGVELVAAGFSNCVSQGDIQGMLSMTLKVVMQRIQDDLESQHDQFPQYMVALKDRAVEYWYPALFRLQRAARKIEGEVPGLYPQQIPALIDQWAAFGALLELDAAEERKRHRDLFRRCWWRGCSRRPTTVKFFQCAGCGDVRYCSKECQRLDWKTGGQKGMCRRLK